MTERVAPGPEIKDSPRRFSRRDIVRAGALTAGAVVLPVGSVAAWEAWLRDVWLRQTSDELRMIPTNWKERPAPDISWASFGPDPKATKDQATWRSVAVVAAPNESVYPFLREDPGNTLVAGYQASATTNGRFTAVGGAENLGIVRNSPSELVKGGAHLAVGFMLGNGALNAALLGKRPDNTLVNFAGLTPWQGDELYTLDNIAHELPGVPVLRRQPA